MNSGTAVNKVTMTSVDSPLQNKFRIWKERRRRGSRELRRIRKSDVVIFSPGNSGRTWLRIMLTRAIELHYQLESGPPLDFDNLWKVDPRIPKITFTHNRWLPYYRKSRAFKECQPYYDSKVVILVRNPLDTCVSQYFQWMHRSKDENIALKGWPRRDSNIDLQAFLDHPDTGVERLCRELNIWLRESKKIRQSAIIRYEDMLENPAKILGRILPFADLDVSVSTLREVVEFGSFDNMRARESKKIDVVHEGDQYHAPQKFAERLKTRRGKVGGYGSYLSQPDCAKFETLVSSQLSAEYGYSELPKILPMNGLTGECDGPG